MTNRLALSKTLMRTFAAAATVALAITVSAASVIAPPSLTLTLKDHRFTPATLTVPVGTRVRITLINRDLATEEFDSHDLRLEQLVTPMGKVSFEIGPLHAGQYSFMGEFHASTAQGKVIAVAAGR